MLTGLFMSIGISPITRKRPSGIEKKHVVFASWLRCLAMLGTKNPKRSQKCLRASHDANIFLQGSSWPDKLLSALSRTIFFKMAHAKHSPLNILKISIFVFAHQPPRAYRKICKHASPINQNVYSQGNLSPHHKKSAGDRIKGQPQAAKSQSIKS